MAGTAAPEPPAGPSDRHAVVEERLETVRRILHRDRASGALLTRRRDFAWLTAGGANHVVLATEEGAAPLLVTPDRAIVLAPVNEADRLRDEELPGTGLDLVPVPWETATASHAMAERLAGGPLLDGLALEVALAPIRARLDVFELARMAWLAGSADSILGDVLVDPAGATELELAAEVERLVTRSGARASVLLAAADERIARYRHPLPTSMPVRARAMLVLVVERWGLHAATTRFAELVPPDADLACRWACARSVLSVMLAASTAGTSLGEVLAAGEHTYGVHGHPDEPRRHHQGGLIGYASRDRIATPGDPFVLQPGMAVAWNPSLEGVKVEVTAVVRSAGAAQPLA